MCPPPCPTLFPYTTLFRSTSDRDAVRGRIGVVFQDPSLDQDLTCAENMEIHGVLYGVPRKIRRSEEHTSELQSHSELVCRLLLEKKKKRMPGTALPQTPRG